MNSKIKHPHAEIIKKWLDDQTAAFEEYDSISSGLIDVGAVISDTCGERQIRIKEFNLTSGHWYPCVDCDGEDRVFVFIKGAFQYHSQHNEGERISPESMEFIGDSLGELKFK